MNCNFQIHDELKNMEESVCPFCNQLLVKWDIESKLCCFEQNIENNNGMNVCLNCGSVHGYDYLNDFIDFHENILKIKKKSVYHRKYHIENVLYSICYGNRVELTHNQRDRIYKVSLRLVLFFL